MSTRASNGREFRDTRNSVIFSAERYMTNSLGSVKKETAADYDVVLAGIFNQSQEEISQFIYAGEVVMYPNAQNYQIAPKFRTTDGGINLSALRRSKYFEKNPMAVGAAEMLQLLDKVFKVLNEQGLRPLEKMISEVQRSVGYIATRKKGLNVACSPDADAAETVNICLQMIADQLTVLESMTETP